MENYSDLEQKALRVLSGAAVFWSFFIATAMSGQITHDVFAYVSEPFAQAEELGRQAAVMEALQNETFQRPPRPPRAMVSSSTSPQSGRPPLRGPHPDTQGMPGMRQGQDEQSDASSTSLRVHTEAKHCPRPSQALARGGNNMPDQVKELQQFLADRYAQRVDDLVTGHFGPLTEKFLTRFQSEQGLSPVGSVGPLTRAALARQCASGGTSGTGTGTTTASSATLRVTPTTGAAPLATTFTVSAKAGNYSLTFGDGASTTVGIPSIQCVTTPCVPPTPSVTHTYQSSGTYTATLTSQVPGSEAVISTAKVTVTSPTQ